VERKKSWYLREGYKMKITVEIKTDNAAFEDRYEHQMREIIDQLSFMLISGRKIGYLRDINGNNVGIFEVKEDK